MTSRVVTSKAKLFASGAGVGLIYGLVMRLGMQWFHESHLFLVMSIGFLFFVPFAMGFISIYWIERREPQGFAIWVFLPWLVILAGTLAAMLALWEGAICAVLFFPVAITFASLGGIIGGFSARWKRATPTRNVLVGCVLILPLLVTPVESRIFSRYEVRRVETAIDMHASPAVVWRNIKSVRAIQPDELTPSWTRRIGFPAPVEATLSHEGVGGVRHATFAGGVLFIETVDVWQPDRRLAFSIHAQTTEIPAATLDEHVRVGGEFFDVLRGEYVIENLPNGNTRLNLSSQQRVSTDFNWYARLWTDAIMRDTQRTILRVIKNRCEAEANKTN
jgi:hypothetical protein